jgi:hypothetical protein
MPVAETERAFDRRTADIALHAKGAEPKPRQADALGLQIFHDELLKDLKHRMNHRRCRMNGRFVEAIGGTAGPPFASLPAAQVPNQDRVMVKALRRWLEANELLAIVTGVAGALVLLSLVLVLGGYLIVTR